MQLKRRLTGVLSIATCNLLNLSTLQAEQPWQVDSAVMFYSEKNRVSAFEPILSAKRELSDDEFLSYKLTLDSLTGASATGAVPSRQIQTFSRPSGKGLYQVEANQTPLDDTFRDTRAQFNLSWDKPLDRNNRRSLGFNISREYDFTSIGGNASWTREYNQKNTALSAGFSLELDSINPVGDVPLALSSQDINTPIQRDGSSKDKQIIDLLAGVTQIIDRYSLIQLNLSVSLADGYMNDPYKLVSIVDTTAGPNQGEPLDQIYENRPDSRQKTAVFTGYKHQFKNSDILNLSYRFMRDDWGIKSHTFDLNYRFRFASGFYIQPHYRHYEQSAADFYRYFLLDSAAIPGTVSADYRLGELQTQTHGVKFGYSDKYRNNWSFRIEQYLQSGESHPPNAIGQLRDQDLYPDVEALIVQFSYSFQW